MNSYHARNLINYTVDQIWQLPNTTIELIFEDETIQARGRQTIISWYMWELHRRYPQTPILSRHYMGNSSMGSKTHLNVLSNVMFDCFDTYKHEDEIYDIEVLSKIVYETVNWMYNDFNKRLSRYVTSISAVDVCEIMSHPKIAELNKLVRPNIETEEHTVDNTYRKIEKIIKDPNEFDKNPFARIARFGLVSMGQVVQCIGPRGYTTDIDSFIFRKPILTGFAEGMLTIEDLAKESRSASKSLIFQKGPMQDAEYLNRAIQLMAENVAHLNHGDCGSTETIPFCVKPGDIEDLLGIYYQSDQGLRRITEHDHHLVGKVIHIRNVFTCKDPDPHGICSVCFGDMALSIPKKTNIGHFSAVELQAKLSQSVLSVKHQDSSSNVEDIVLSDFEKRYIRKGSDPNVLFLSSSLKNADFSITLPSDCLRGIHDLMYIGDMVSAPITRISEFGEIQLTIKRNNEELVVVLNVSAGTRMSSFSKEALDYIKKKGWTINESGEITIDMSEWNIDQPIFTLPLKHYSMIDFMKSIEACLKGTTKKNEPGPHRSLLHYDEVSDALMAFQTLVSSKIHVNLSHLQVIILSTMVCSREGRNYYLPAAGEIGEFCRYQQLMFNRSLSATMAYERQEVAITDIRSYIITDRPNHPLDDVLLP